MPARVRLMEEMGDEGPISLMRQVLVLRHAKSARDDPDVADFERPLAPKGEQAARAMAQHLERAAVRPALILCSGAVRARQTMAAVTAALGTIETAVEDELYLLGAEGLLERLRRVDGGVGSVMVIGHNPGMHGLALALADDDETTCGQQLRAGFPTGALAILDWVRSGAGTGEWSELAPGCCRLRGFVRPRDL